MAVAKGTLRGGTPYFTTGFEPRARPTLYSLVNEKTLGDLLGAAYTTARLPVHIEKCDEQENLRPQGNMEVTCASNPEPLTKGHPNLIP